MSAGLLLAPAGRAPVPTAPVARASRSAASPAAATLLAFGGLAGVYSGLFGIGAGTIIVPLLVLRLGYSERVATGTSQAAIAIMAIAGITAHSAYGNVHVVEGLLLGVPAVGGVMVGTRLQQSVPTRALSLAMVVLLAVVGVSMAIA